LERRQNIGGGLQDIEASGLDLNYLLDQCIDGPGPDLQEGDTITTIPAIRRVAGLCTDHPIEEDWLAGFETEYNDRLAKREPVVFSTPASEA